MTYYIRLLRFTKTGAATIKDFSKVRADFLRRAGELGIKVHAEYITLGRYDLVTILEAADEKAILKLHTSFAAPGGRVSSETLTAVTADEFENIVKSV
ncbi:MAG: GYD domain-containing protein [Nitrososphaerales archaeon]